MSEPLAPSGMIEKRGSQLLLDFLELVGGWPVTGDVWNASVGKARAQWQPRTADGTHWAPGAEACRACAGESDQLLASSLSLRLGPSSSAEGHPLQNPGEAPSPSPRPQPQGRVLRSLPSDPPAT